MENWAAKLIIPFTDPAIVGWFVFHCHVVKPEDKGMMMTVEVVRWRRRIFSAMAFSDADGLQPAPATRRPSIVARERSPSEEVEIPWTS